MTEAKTVSVHIRGPVDFRSAETVVSRVRAAMLNDADEIVVSFAPEAEITSAEFMAFLAAAAKHLAARKRRLVVRGIEGRSRALFKIARLESLIAVEETHKTATPRQRENRASEADAPS